MSSTTYLTELQPEPALRGLVVSLALAGLAAGCLILLLLPVDRVWRVAALILWSLNTARELSALLRGYRRCRRVRLWPGGRLQVVAPDGCCTAATLRPGSVAGASFAWLRFSSEDGCRHAELVRARKPQTKDWRRLRVIWRHMGTAQ